MQIGSWRLKDKERVAFYVRPERRLADIPAVLFLRLHFFDSNRYGTACKFSAAELKKTWL